MATPDTNWVPITDLSFSGLSAAEASLIDGAKWGAGGYGTGVTLTYSFPSDTAYYSSDYGADNEWDSYYSLNDDERSAVRLALAEVSWGANVIFQESADNGDVVGELRFTGSYSISSYAHAYVPFGDYPDSGDVWLSGDWNPEGAAIPKGSYEYLTIVHEVGHALGLKHPFEEGMSGETLPPEYDNYFWTVMSYTAKAGVEEDVDADFYPTTLMYIDLVALEKLYGPSTTANLGNTQYVYHENQTYWETIVDSGGIDTISYDSISNGGRIDLSNADFSRMGKSVHFTNGTSSRDTIGLGPSTLIENANGGGGDDILIGSHRANRLNGMGGSDRLTGNGGDDVLNGGDGADRLFAGGGNDTMIWTAGDRFDGGAGGADVLKIAGTLNLGGVDDARIVDVERINLSRGGITLWLKASDVLALSSTTDTLRILGNDAANVNIAGSFATGATSGGYTTYTIGAATLLIDSHMDVV